MCRCMYVGVDMRMCMNMIVSCMSILDMFRLYVVYDYVQRCEDIYGVELRNIR